MDNSTSLYYVPWNWSIQSLDPTVAKCPSASQVLGTFAWVNAAVSVISVIAGNHYVSRTLTCKLLGRDKNDDGGLYWLTWIFPFGTQLAGNVVNAWMMQRALGYKTTYSLWGLTLFLTIRPRLGVVFLGVLDLCTKGAYTAANLSSSVAEIFLQLFSAYTTVRVAFLATNRDYYKLNLPTDKTLPDGARLMYAGALLHIIAIFIFGGHFLLRLAEPVEERSRSWRFFVVIILPFPWIGSWLFWAGFVKLMGPLFCPPAFKIQGAIWIAFSAVGVLLGGATA